MKYNFIKKIVETTNSVYFLIETDDNNQLENFGDSGWTSSKIQKIIDGLEDSKTKPKGEEYLWGNEDVNLYANENGVLLIDVLAQRAGQHNPDDITLRLTHGEIIQFLQDFKKFVEENN